jgi:N-acetylglucosamine malate deacetylase 1
MNMLGSAIDSVLVVAAHADDEALGCGATMALLARRGIKVHVLFIADGVGARDANAPELAQRRASAERAAAVLGARVLEHGDLPDNRLDTVALLDVVQRVERAVERCRPQVVLTHHAGDLNIDHRIVHQAAVTACRPQPGHGVRGLLFFEVPSSTEWQPPGSAPAFQPDYFIDASETLAAKRAALECYAHEMRAWPHARSFEALEHLARWRGATVGVAAAEAFVVGRWIDRT